MSFFGTNTVANSASQQLIKGGTTNAMNDFDVPSPPDDTVSSLEFSPTTVQQVFLASASWDNNIRCWEVSQSNCVPKAQQSLTGPVLDLAWTDDGTKIVCGSADKTVRAWDLASNQLVQVGQHDGPVKTVHWVKAPNYSCIMTGSWDKTLRFWDMRSPSAMLVINLPERVYCADAKYPMAAVGRAGKQMAVYTIENQPKELQNVETQHKFQYRSGILQLRD